MAGETGGFCESVGMTSEKVVFEGKEITQCVPRVTDDEPEIHFTPDPGQPAPPPPGRPRAPRRTRVRPPPRRRSSPVTAAEEVPGPSPEVSLVLILDGPPSESLAGTVGRADQLLGAGRVPGPAETSLAAALPDPNLEIWEDLIKPQLESGQVIAPPPDDWAQDLRQRFAVLSQAEKEEFAAREWDRWRGPNVSKPMPPGFDPVQARIDRWRLDEAHNAGVVQGYEFAPDAALLGGIARRVAARVAWRVEGELVSRGLWVGDSAAGGAGGLGWGARVTAGGAPAVVGGAVTSRRSVRGWFAFWNDQGGVTVLHPVKNPTFFRRYSPVVQNFDVPGTAAYLDTAAHEGVHVFTARYLPFITAAGDARLATIPVGAPVKYAEELFAYSGGHLAAGRIHALPFVPLEALGSLTPGEGAVVLVTGAGTGYVTYRLQRPNRD